MELLGQRLQELYEKYNNRSFVHPDPLEFLYNYSDIKDREIVGLIASLLAYGRVTQILKSVSIVLNIIKEPFKYLNFSSNKDIRSDFKYFRHRFTGGDDISNLLIALKLIINEYGSLNNCFLSCVNNDDDSVIPALRRFIKKLGQKINNNFNSLISNPEGLSAYKRFNLYLRWMVRKDNVDPGGWENISASKLIIPLDTHMYKICRNLKFTYRKQADLKSAIEITESFKAFAPLDPVKFDFALTRLGINKNIDKSNIFLNNLFKDI